MRTETFTYRDPQVEAVRFPADESLQKQIEQHFNGQIKGTSLPPVERVCEFRDLAGSEITASVGDIIIKSISGSVKVFDQQSFDQMFERDAGGVSVANQSDPVRDDLLARATLIITTATGKDLDEAGVRYGLVRKDGETDHAYRVRIIGYLTDRQDRVDSLHSLLPLFGEGPLKPMESDAARAVARRMADLYRPSYWKENFYPHTWVVAAILEASTAPHFLKK